MRFLIVKTSSLGDIIHTFGVISYLRKRYPSPSHKIHWVVEKNFKEIVESHPEIDQVICINTKEWRKGKNLSEISVFRTELKKYEYDAVFDLQGNIKSSFVTTQTRSVHKVGFDWKSCSEWPSSLCLHHRFHPKKKGNIREDYLSIVKQYFNDKTDAPVDEITQLKLPKQQLMLMHKVLASPILLKGQNVMVCPGSAWKNKQLPFDSLIHLLQKLQKKKNCVFLFIWGTEEEKRFAEELKKHFHDFALVVDRVPLPVLQNLMMHMKLVISVDSVALHLAGTAGVPTLGIFGPSSMEKYRPLGLQHFSYQGICPYNKAFSKRCKILRTCNGAPCMSQLTGDEIIDTFLNSPNAKAGSEEADLLNLN